MPTRPFLSKTLFKHTALALLTGAIAFSQPASAEKYQGHLSQLLLNKPSLYLPTRLIMGQDNRFVIKARAGTKVRLYFSEQDSGLTLPSGAGLHVGAQNTVVTGVVPENGVLAITVPIPASAAQHQEALLAAAKEAAAKEAAGKPRKVVQPPSAEDAEFMDNNDADKDPPPVLYVDAAAGQADDLSDFAPVDFIDASGHRTDTHALALAEPAKAGGHGIMPSLPGLPAQMMQQVTTLSQIYANPDDTRKQLLDNGQMDHDALLDKNPFIQSGTLQPGSK